MLMLKARISMTIDEGVLARIDRVAEDQGVARSALIERLLLEAVTEEEMLNQPAVKQMLVALSSRGVIENLSKALDQSLSSEQMDTVSRKLKRISAGASRKGGPASV